MYTLVLVQSEYPFMGVLNTPGDYFHFVNMVALSREVRTSIYMLLTNPIPGQEILVRTVGLPDTTVEDIAVYPGWRAITNVIILQGWRETDIPGSVIGNIWNVSGLTRWHVDLRSLCYFALRDRPQVNWSLPMTLAGFEDFRVLGNVVDYLTDRLHGTVPVESLNGNLRTVEPAPPDVLRMIDYARGWSWRSFHRICPSENIRAWAVDPNMRIVPLTPVDLFNDRLFDNPPEQARLFAHEQHGHAGGAQQQVLRMNAEGPEWAPLPQTISIEYPV